MNLRKLLVGMISAAACVTFAASTAFAGPIFVNNFSFETLPGAGLPFGCGAGCSFSNDLIPGWTVTNFSQTGQFQPGSNVANFTYFNSVPDGITVAYTNGGTIFQTVLPTVGLGVTYTLKVDQGVRHDALDPGIVELLIGGNPPIIATGIPAAPLSGTWSTYTATYIGLSTDVGKPISIELLSAGPQGDWDNVRLDSTAIVAGVPEPMTLALFGAGLAGLGALRRRRKAKA